MTHISLDIVTRTSISEYIWPKPFSFPNRSVVYETHVRSARAQFVDVIKSYYGQTLPGRCSPVISDLPLLNSVTRFLVVIYKGHRSLQVSTISIKKFCPLTLNN